MKKGSVSSCADGGSESRRAIMLIGDNARLDEVTAALSDLKVSLQRAVIDDGVVPDPAPGICAAVIVTLDGGVAAEDALRTLADDREDQSPVVPCFVIVGDDTSDKSVRALYSAGAISVFLWPSEASQLADLIAERLGIVFARGLTPERDAALSRTIRAHLRSSSKIPSNLKVSTHRGVVELRGEVDSLWKKRELESHVYDVPGVRRVVSRDVRVPPANRSDEDIERAIRSVLSAASEIYEETIAASSMNGFVTLAGSVDDRSEARRILEMVTHVRGVRDIEFLVTISPETRTAERNVAKRLKRGIERLLHKGTVKVTVFGNTAVLTGKVRDQTVRGLIESFVSRDNAIQRVVNKISDEENTV